MNHVYLAGNLVRDPEMRYLDGGKSVTNFTIALNERGKDGKEYTSYIRCSAWNELGVRIAEQAKLGTRVVLEGKLVQRTWTDKENKKHDELSVTVQSADVVLKQAPVTIQRDPQDVGDLPF